MTRNRILLIIAAAVTVALGLLGALDNGVVYAAYILGIPIILGALAGLGRGSWRDAWVTCVAFGVLDFAFDDERMDDIVFFVVLVLVMIGIAWLARLAASRLARRQAEPA